MLRFSAYIITIVFLLAFTTKPFDWYVDKKADKDIRGQAQGFNVSGMPHAKSRRAR